MNARKYETHLHSIKLGLINLDTARGRIDTNMQSLRAGEVSDAIEAIDETLLDIFEALKLLAPVKAEQE